MYRLAAARFPSRFSRLRVDPDPTTDTCVTLTPWIHMISLSPFRFVIWLVLCVYTFHLRSFQRLRLFKICRASLRIFSLLILQNFYRYRLVYRNDFIVQIILRSYIKYCYCILKSLVIV